LANGIWEEGREYRVQSIESRARTFQDRSAGEKPCRTLGSWRYGIGRWIMQLKSSQIRRAVCSIPLNIAEGSGCESQKEFRLFLGYAHRSTHEVLTILELMDRLKLCQIKEVRDLLEKGKEIRAMIHALMKRLQTLNS
jgi:four helix bundle protein